MIALLWERCQLLRERIPPLESQIKDLENGYRKTAKIAVNYLPVMEQINPNPKSRRQKSQRKAGGQKGHIGHRLNPMATPNHMVEYSMTQCDHCSEDLAKISGNYAQRQVFDIPVWQIEVTEHRVQRKMCQCCGHETQAKFPREVSQLIQYGHRIKALIVYLNQYQLLPFHRLGDFFGDVFHQTMSVGTFVNAKRQAYQKVSLMEDPIKDLLTDNQKLYVDETSLRVMKQRSWLHVASTKQLTYYAIHAKRGGEAIDEIGLLLTHG